MYLSQALGNSDVTALVLSTIVGLIAGAAAALRVMRATVHTRRRINVFFYVFLRASLTGLAIAGASACLARSAIGDGAVPFAYCLTGTIAAVSSAFYFYRRVSS
jgi:hypothetical protein